ncbi:MAG: hypothetical protein H6818_08720 [Phycisphaerales bacterium]|nr:hypothetical protein [Phycisphaerales bacterium]MCB9862653.1 hypothetical protein [Phycisphaerales bacterium]
MASFNKEFIRRVTPVLEPAGFCRNPEHKMRFERDVAGHRHLVDADLSTRASEARLYLAIDRDPFRAESVGLLAECGIEARTAEDRTAAAEQMALILSDAGMRFFAKPYSQTRAEWGDQAGFRIFDDNPVVCTIRRLNDWHKTRATLRILHNHLDLGVGTNDTIEALAANQTVHTKAMSRFDAFDLHERINDAGLVLDAPLWDD